MKKWSIAFAAAAVAVAVAVPVVGGTAKKEVNSRIAVVKDIEVYLELPGSIQAGESAAVICGRGGKVDKVFVKEGDIVSKGQKLASVIAPSEPDEEAVSAAAEASAANFASSEAKRRMRELAMSAGCDINTFNAYMSEKERDVPVFEQSVEATEDISAPIAGKVMSVETAEGGFIETGMAAAVIADTDACVIKAMVNEDDIDIVYADMPAEFTPEGKTGSFTGKVTAVSDSVTVTGAQRKQVEIEITPSDKFSGIIGRSAGVRLLVKSAKNVLTVPVDAVADGHVFVITSDGTLDRRAVSTGITNGEDIEITDGLFYGERVVTYPSEELEDGMAVKAVD